ncbi:hypothetical protein BE08_04985 [Sorangium cellulosum]|uniref:Uncharacterized protein n=1 Tax=Sorangium cellulosum TaxID=56 RepID=A0A150PJJ4_SORCE|nr:hypothetical protein BE08_04985 [Sorangium cellulosum]
MADEIPKRSTEIKIAHAAELSGTTVRVTKDHALQVEFQVEDLIKKLIPGGIAASSCGGCNGCSGCSM